MTFEYTIEKVYRNEAYLPELEHNQCVMVGNGLTYHLKVTADLSLESKREIADKHFQKYLDLVGEKCPRKMKKKLKNKRINDSINEIAAMEFHAIREYKPTRP